MTTQDDRTDSDIWPVLTGDLLQGSTSVTRFLSPPVTAHLVGETDLGHAIRAMRTSAGAWGGAYSPLVSVDSESHIDPLFRRILGAGALDYVSAHESGWLEELASDPSLGDRVSAAWATPLLSVLARVDASAIKWDAILVADGVPETDPWYIAYAGILGVEPETPTEIERKVAGLPQDLDYGDLVVFEGCDATPPDPIDLLDRMRRVKTITGSQLTTLPFPIYAAVRNSGLGQGAGHLESRYRTALNVGPNIVVVYAPGSVRDLCLLRHLRATHGFPPGLPLGVPSTVDVRSALDLWRRASALRGREEITSVQSGVAAGRML